MIENQRNELCSTKIERFFPELWRDATPPSRMVGVVNNDKRELAGKAQSYKAAPRKYVRTDKDKCPGSDGRKKYGRLHDIGAHAILSLNIGLPGKVLFLNIIEGHEDNSNQENNPSRTPNSIASSVGVRLLPVSADTQR